MKAISLHQPWASLIACGGKSYETRSWKTDYRGLIAIHAAKTMDYLEVCLTQPFASTLVEGGIRYPKELPFGAIVAVAKLDKCVHIVNGWRPRVPHMPHEVDFGDYSEGRYAWDLHSVRALPQPIPCRGFQGLWTVRPEVEAEIQRQLGVRI